MGTRWAPSRKVAGLIRFRLHYDPGIASASNRNEYQEYFLRVKGGRCVGLITFTENLRENWRTTMSKVFLEVETVPPLIREFPACYGTKWFIAVFTTAHNLSLSWDKRTQFAAHRFLRFILILSSHLRLGIPSGFTSTPDAVLFSMCITCPPPSPPRPKSHPTSFHDPHNMKKGAWFLELPVINLSAFSYWFVTVRLRRLTHHPTVPRPQPVSTLTWSRFYMAGRKTEHLDRTLAGVSLL